MPPTTLFFLLLLLFSLSIAREDDIKCLQGIKSTVSDPQNKLSTWSLTSHPNQSICSIFGVSCWNEKENRLISLSLPSLSLSGSLPPSLRFCNSLQSLDFSNNAFSAQIPPQICDWLPYLVTLDLSSNSFSGPIPAELGNCKFLNTLNLARNQLLGPLNYQLGRLDRLKKLDFSDNRLSGVVLESLERFSKESFDGNGGLCGGGLGSKCGGLSNRSLGIIIVAVGFGVWLWFVRRRGRKYGKGEGG